MGQTFKANTGHSFNTNMGQTLEANTGYPIYTNMGQHFKANTGHTFNTDMGQTLEARKYFKQKGHCMQSTFNVNMWKKL